MERRMRGQIERAKGTLGDRGYDFFRTRVSEMQHDMNTQAPNIIGQVIQAENQLSQVGNIATNENIRKLIIATEPVKKFYKTFQPSSFMNMSNDEYKLFTRHYTQQRNLLQRDIGDRSRSLAAGLHGNKAVDTARNGFIASTTAFLQAAKQDLLSKRLKPAIPEHREAFKGLDLKPDERWLLVGRLDLKFPLDREAFKDLDLKPDERLLLVGRLKLEIPEDREAFKDLKRDLTSDERSQLVGRLKLEIPEDREAFKDLKRDLTPHERSRPVGRLDLGFPEDREAFKDLKRDLEPDERWSALKFLDLGSPEDREAFKDLKQYLEPDERLVLVRSLDLKIPEHREAFRDLKPYLEPNERLVLTRRLNPALPEHREIFEDLSLTPDEATYLVMPKFMERRYVTEVTVDNSNKSTKNITANIREKGQIPYAEFMSESLVGEHGYYREGKADISNYGDFITSPQRTELFGAGMGMTTMKVWEAMGKPSSFDVIEMGAGNGDMAIGLLKWAQGRQPEFYKAIKYQIVEVGSLIQIQQKNLKQYEEKVTWKTGSAYEQSFEGIEGVFIFNELVDTFPVDRLRLKDGEVLQKYVKLDENNRKWVELWDKPTPEVEKELAYMKNDLGYNLILQEDAEEPLNPEALNLQRRLDKSLKRGAIINIDYGRNGEVARRGKPAIQIFGDRAGKRAIEDLHLHPGERELLRGYYNPGNVDITSDVNFAPLIAQARKDGLNVAFEGLQADLLHGVGTRDLAKQYHQALGSATTWPEYCSLLREINGFFDVIDVEPSPIYSKLGRFYSTLLTKGIDSKALQFKKMTDEDNMPLDTPYVSIDVGKPNTPITITLPERSYTHYSGHDGIFRQRLEEFSIKPEEFAKAVITYKKYDGEDVVLDLGGDKELQERFSQLEKSSLSIHEYSSQVASIIFSHSRQIQLSD